MKPLKVSRNRSYALSFASHWRDSMFWQDIIVRNVLLPVIFRKNGGVQVLSQPWDNLVILDACRYDSFEKLSWKLNGIGRLESRTSVASDTRSFLRRSFVRDKYDDIVYVAANPQVSRFMRGRFHAIIPVWMNGWDEAQSTVLPETVAEQALAAANRYPGKRLIIHFMQPHHPYLGFKPAFSKMRRIEKRPPNVFSPWPKSHSWYTYFLTHRRGDLLKLYESNLAKVMETVARMVPELEGTTVVTSDHGEAFGERLHPLFPLRVYEHPPNVRIQALVRVPWYSIEAFKTARSAMPGSTTPEEFGIPDEELTRERLRALGYE